MTQPLTSIRGVFDKHIFPALVTTSEAPSVAELDGDVFVCWKGAGNDNINIAVWSRATNTLGNTTVFTDTCAHSPSLTVHKRNLYVAWRGSNNKNLNLARVPLARAGDTWTVVGQLSGTKITPPNEYSEQAPAIASHRGWLYLAYRSIGDGHIHVSYSKDDGATFHTALDSSDTCEHAPAIVSHQGELLLAWRGSGNQQVNVALAQMKGWGPELVTAWAHKQVLPETSAEAPALASCGVALLLAFKGAGNDHINLMVSTEPAPAFDDKFKFIPDKEDCDGAPALFGTHLAWKGSGNENLNLARVDLRPSISAPSLDEPFNFIQRKQGPHKGDFELVIPQGTTQLARYWRDNSDPAVPWFGPEIFGRNERYRAATVIEAANGHLEVVARTSASEFHHFWRDDAGWHEGTAPIDVGAAVSFRGVSLVQRASGDLELFVGLEDIGLCTLARDATTLQWTGVTVIDSVDVSVAPAAVLVEDSPVVLVKPGADEPIVEFTRDGNGVWHKHGPIVTAEGEPVAADAGFALAATTSNYGAGNIELVYMQQTPTPRFRKYYADTAFLPNVWHATDDVPTPKGALYVNYTLMQSTYNGGNLEVLAQALGAHELVGFYRDHNDQKWHGPFPAIG